MYLKRARRFAYITCYVPINELRCNFLIALEPRARWTGTLSGTNIFLKNSSQFIASRDRDIACKISLWTHRSSRSWYNMSQYSTANLCVCCAIFFYSLPLSFFFIFFMRNRALVVAIRIRLPSLCGTNFDLATI